MSSLRSRIVLLVGVLQCLGHAAAKFRVLDTTPLYPHDSNTTPYCTWWLDSDGSWTCQDVYDIYGISAADFLQWNPSLSASCQTLPAKRSFCVEAPLNPISSTSTPPSVTATVTSTTTAVSNGVTTPTPAQPGMTSNCNRFAQVWENAACVNIAFYYSTTVEDIIAWNGGTSGDVCNHLQVGVYVCVGVLSGAVSTTTAAPTATTGPNGISTPLPTQLGMVSNCDKFALVWDGASCDNVAFYYSITADLVEEWNAGVGGASCDKLQAGAYACVHVVGFVMPTTTAVPTATTGPNGISTPLPTQLGMVSNCDKFALVWDGASCDNVAFYNSITADLVGEWNAGVGGASCDKLQAGTYACVHVVGYVKPTTTTTGNGIATPTPTQPGMVSNCKKFTYVHSGDTCNTIAFYNGISTDDFILYNTGVGGKACTGLQANTYCCIGV